MLPISSGFRHVSPGRERRLRTHLVSLRPQCRLSSRSFTPATRADPQAVDADWQSFFQSLRDDARGRRRECARPLLATARWPPTARDELVAALDGDWPEVGTALNGKIKAPGANRRRRASRPPRSQRATRDSIRALMLIRAYRTRGHFHANLDPLGLEPPQRPGGTRSAVLWLCRGRLRPPDLPRPRARP